MYKKTLLTLLIVLFGTLSYAQIYSYENLFFELYDTEDNIFLKIQFRLDGRRQHLVDVSNMSI